MNMRAMRGALGCALFVLLVGAAACGPDQQTSDLAVDEATPAANGAHEDGQAREADHVAGRDADEAAGRGADEADDEPEASDDADGAADVEGSGEADDAAPPSSPEPADVADPARVRIPAIGVDAAITAVGLQGDGAMETPPLGSHLVGWYDPGPKPGEVGPAVLAGHVSSAAHGPDVFHRLVEVAPGDEIHVDLDDGSTVTYVATSNERTPKDQLPRERIWSGDDEPVLRLITCGGAFDSSAGSHVDNDIVYAELAD